RPDAGGRGGCGRDPGDRQQRPRGRGLRDPARPGGPLGRPRAQARGRRGRRRPLGSAPGRGQAVTRPLAAPGHMGVDYEERVDFARLRDYRLSRARAALEASECGAFLLFDFYNIRYTTHTWIGGALGDKMIRYALITRDRDPVLWDFGSAVKHHKI